MSFQEQIEITGNAAAALGAIGVGLGQLQARTEKAKPGVDHLNKSLNGMAGNVGGIRNLRVEFGNLFHSFAGFRREADGGWIFNIANGLQSAARAAEWFARSTFNALSGIVEIVDKTQDLDRAIKLNVGEAKAKEIGQLADGLSQALRIDDDTIKQALLPLLARGVVDPTMLKDMVTVARDVSFRQGTGEAGFSANMEAFSRIALKKDVNSRILESLRLNEMEFYQNMGATMNISEEAARKLVDKGKVDGQSLINMALREVARTTGQPFGAASIESQQDIGDSLSSLKRLKEDLIKSLADSDTIKNLGNTIAEFDQTVRKFAAENPIVGEIFLAALVAVAGMFVVLGAAIVAIPVAIGALFVGAFKLSAWLADLIPKAWQFGKDIVAGFIGGIGSMLTAAKDAIFGLGDSVVGWFKEKLQISSPSQVFARLGEFTGEGFAIGLESTTDRIADAARRGLVDLIALPQPGQGATAGGGNVVYLGGITVEINGSASSYDGKSIAQEIRAELGRFFDEAGFVMGGA